MSADARPVSLLRRSACLPGGGLSIAGGPDALLVIGALSDAAVYRGRRIERCAVCVPGAPCDAHAGDEQLLASYRSLSLALGDDR